MRKYSRAFTLVELVVVVTIVSILTAVSIVSYSGYTIDANDAARVADFNQIKIGLKTAKQKTGSYPLPADKFAITNSGSDVAYQGVFSSDVAINNVNTFPKDPKIDVWYGYAVTHKRQAFQLAATLENDGTPKAYVDGTYKSIAMNVLPSLFLATTTTSEIQSGSVAGDANRKKFIIDGGKYNLLYNFKKQMVTNTTRSFDELFPEGKSGVTGNTDYADCKSIYEAGMSIWPGEYQIRAADGSMTNSGCLMVY